MHPDPQQLVLVIGGHGTPLSSLAERTRRLGYRVVRAKTPLDALELADERGYRFGTALFEPSLPIVDLKRALAELRERSDSDDLIFIATGDQPDVEGREQLRRAAVDLALWEPVGSHALRFLLNRALSSERDGWLRAELRVPTEIAATVWNAGREKAASIYSLSNGGAFLATACPCLRGAEIAIELPLPRGAVTVAARVLYTNVPGNLHSGRLPNGMGIRFTDAPAEAHRAIRHAVSEQAAYFVI
jgi:hypothetical protein